MTENELNLSTDEQAFIDGLTALGTATKQTEGVNEDETSEDVNTGTGTEGDSKAQEENQEDDPNQPPTPPQVKPTKAQQQEYAFAQLRSENKAFKEAMKDVAKVLGIEDDKNPFEAIKTKALELQSKQTNVPLDVLQKLDYLTQRDAELTRRELEQHAYLGFQAVKTEFKLDDKALQNFAEALQAEGINPFAEKMDLKKEYIARNYATLLTAAEERGRQEEAQRAAKAQNQSTTLNRKIGGEPGEQTAIKSVSDLSAFFNEMNKK